MKPGLTTISRCLLSFTAAACQLLSEFRPPLLGYVPGASPQTLVRIDGIPGASQAHLFPDMGEPAGSFEWLSVSAEHDYALAIRSGDRDVVLIRLNGEQQDVHPLPVQAPADRIALSQSGTIAAVYSSANNSIQVTGGLPDRPVHHRTISTAALKAGVRSLAVSDDGSIVLASSGTEAGELLITTENGSEVISLPAAVSTIVFRPKRHDAVIVAGQEALLATGLPERVSLQALGGPASGLGQPAAAEFSRDGRRIYIADSGARAIHIIEPDHTAPATTVPCDCSATELRRLRGEAVFWLNEHSAGNFRIFDNDSVAPRVLLVPHTPLTN